MNMKIIVVATLTCCLLALTSAQLPGMTGMPAGGMSSMLPLLLSRGGAGGEALNGLLLMSLMNQGGGRAGGSNLLMPLLMMMMNRGASASEMMPLLMMTQEGAGGAGGIASNPMMMVSLLQGNEQLMRMLPLMLMNQQAGEPGGAGVSTADPGSQPAAANVAPLLLSGAMA